MTGIVLIPGAVWLFKAAWATGGYGALIVGRLAPVIAAEFFFSALFVLAIAVLCGWVAYKIFVGRY